MSDLKDAMLLHMAHLNFEEYVSFSDLDFSSFEVDGNQYTPVYGTVRNYFKEFRKEGKIKKDGKGRPQYYVLTECNLNEISITHTHMGGSLLSLATITHYTQNSRIYQWTSKASTTYA